MRRQTIIQFQKTILDWYKKEGRHDLPWRRTRDIRDPYRILVSELMLQQTQVDRVIPKYESFLRRFPTSNALARASTLAVLKEWKGLGYNRRALYLKRAAEKITNELGGKFPTTEEGLRALPGVGEYTARAVSVFAQNEPKVFIETNIRRVFIHFFFGDVKSISDRDILPLVEKAIWKKDPRLWYGALMDYGAIALKGVPNPNRRSATYSRQSKFEGSTRQARAKIIEFLLPQKSGNTTSEVRAFISTHKLLKPHLACTVLDRMLATLEREGFLQRRQGRWRIRG